MKKNLILVIAVLVLAVIICSSVSASANLNSSSITIRPNGTNMVINHVINNTGSTASNATSTKYRLHEQKEIGSGAIKSAIYKNYIVYEYNYTNTDHDIYLYNTETSILTSVCSSSYNQLNPAIYGTNIVWQDSSIGGGNYAIQMYNILTGTTRQMTSGWNDTNPTISETQIVWERVFSSTDHELRNCTVYNTDPNNFGMVTSSGVAENPKIYQDTVVWQENRDYNYQIYMKNLRTGIETKVGYSSNDLINPSIYGDIIVWENVYSSLDHDVEYYSISSNKTKAVTTLLSMQWNPQIYGDKIVYQDNSNGNNVYMYDLQTNTNEKVTNVSSGITSPSYVNPVIYGNTIAFINSPAPLVGGNNYLWIDQFYDIPQIGIVPPIAGVSSYTVKVNTPIPLPKNPNAPNLFINAIINPSRATIESAYSDNVNRVNVPPQVVTLSPTINAVNVPRDVTISLIFTEPINIANVNNIKLRNHLGNSVPITCTVLNGNVLSIRPNSILSAGEEYTVTLHTGAISDKLGVYAEPWGYSFTTVNDNIAPYVRSVSPTNNAVNVARNQPIVFTFNEPVKKPTTCTVTIVPASGGSAISYGTTVNGHYLTVTHALLAANTRYRVILATGCVKDLAGNPIAAYSTYFTTGST